MYDLNVDGTNDLNQSIQAVVTNINLTAILAAPEGGVPLSLAGGIPGFYYTLYGAAGVRALPEGEMYGPELCGASGEVTFSAVKKPSDAAGFFTVTASPETPFTEKGLGE